MELNRCIKFRFKKSENEKIESVRKHLNESFENISCCLLPNPGNTVSVRRASQGSQLYLKDVGDEFIGILDILVKDGNLVNGKDFINFILAYFTIFNSEKMPELDTMLEASAKAGILQCIDQCKTKYRSEMQKKLEGGFQTEEDLQRNHHDLKSAVLLEFDQTPKLGDDEFIKRYRKHLEKNIDLELLIFQQLLKAKLEILKIKVREVANKAVEMYKQSLNEKSGGKYVYERRLEQIEQTSRIASFSLFRNSTLNLPSEVVDSHKPIFSDQLDMELKRFKESNAREGAKNEAFNNYETRIDAATREYKQAGILEELHETEKAKAVGGLFTGGANEDEKVGAGFKPR